MSDNTAPTLGDTRQIAVVAPESSTLPREQILAGAVYVTREAARLIRVQPSTIRAAVRSGQIRGKGRPFRILGSELLKLV